MRIGVLGLRSTWYLTRHAPPITQRPPDDGVPLRCSVVRGREAIMPRELVLRARGSQTQATAYGILVTVLMSSELLGNTYDHTYWKTLDPVRSPYINPVRGSSPVAQRISPAYWPAPNPLRTVRLSCLLSAPVLEACPHPGEHVAAALPFPIIVLSEKSREFQPEQMLEAIMCSMVHYGVFAK